MKKHISSTREYAEMLFHLHRQGTQNQTGVNMYASILRIGKEFKEVDMKESRRLKKEYHCKLGYCYYNAQKIILDGSNEFDYYEGWVGYIIPLEHGWLVSKETGLVVDPTLNKVKKRGDYFGIKIPRRVYHESWNHEHTGRQVMWTYLLERTNGNKARDV